MTSESKEIVPQEVNDFSPNYNNTNHSYISYNDMNYINLINQSGSEGKQEKTDVMDEVSAYIELIKDNIEYVIARMHDMNTKIINIKAYMVTSLYNAPSTINHYYQQEV